MEVLNRYKVEMREDYKYFGRGTPLGNPFEIGVHGSREEVIALFKDYFLTKLAERDPAVEKAFRGLQPTDSIVCSCSPAACHLDIVKEIYEDIWTDIDYETGLKRVLLKYDKICSPGNDGVTHINVYSKAHTKLGRALSNFANLPFTLPVHGRFASIEGFWYWLGTGLSKEKLRELSGYDAKEVGKKLAKVPREDFIAQIKEAIKVKIETYPTLKEAFIKSELPFRHYYYYGKPDNAKVIQIPNDWLADYLTELRSDYKTKHFRLIIAGSRDFMDLDALRQAYKDSGFQATEIVSGGARGADKMGEALAKELGIPVKPFIPDWEKHKKSAGFIRNAAMGDYADAGIVMIVNNSSGSMHMASYLEKLDKPLYVKHLTV